jgi:hypothetical protein
MSVRPYGGEFMTGYAASRTLDTQPDCPPLGRAIMATILFSTIFLTRFARSSAGSRTELSLPLVVLLLGVGTLILTGTVRVSIPRAILFAIAMVAVLTSTMVNVSGEISPTSLLNLIAVYGCYLFTMPGEHSFEWAIRLFRRFMLIIACCGIVQFIAQVAVPGPTLFTFEGILPDNILSHGFNYVIPVPGLINLNKSNGFFLVEPSSLSQMMALAIIVELQFFRASWRLAVLGAALLLAFSGTGLVLFGLIVPLLLMRTGRATIVGIAVPVLILVVAAASANHLAATFDRFSEFDDTQSSGFARFLSPFYLFHDYIFSHLITTLFGLGPGAIESFFDKTSYLIFDPTWGKLIFEYGIVGAIPFMVFVLYCFFAGTRSVWLSAALFINYLVLGGNLVDGRLHALILVLIVFQSRQPERRPALGRAYRDELRPHAAQAPAQRLLRT